VAKSSGRDFFISYTAVNRPFGSGIAVQREAAAGSPAPGAWTVGSPSGRPPFLTH
jgi:hypothetical protein